MHLGIAGYLGAESQRTPGCDAGRPSGHMRYRGLFFGVGGLSVGALLPLIDDVIRARDIALCVIANLADGGRPWTTRLNRLGDLLGVVGGAGLGDGSGNHLNRRVGVERVGLRFETCGAELLDEILGGGVLARIRRECIQGR